MESTDSAAGRPGTIDLLALDLRTRRALTWSVPCAKNSVGYGCGAAAERPCLHDGEPWHSYRSLPSGEIQVNYNSFPFHSARWKRAATLNMLEVLAIVSRDGGSFDPGDLTLEEARRYIESMNDARQH